jgi:hypothetical protein
MFKRTTITLAHMSALADQAVVIDAPAGIIKGVSIIQAGEALGHGFEVDAVMLKQTMDAINAKPKGVKSRLTHPGLPDCGGWDGLEVTLGRVKNARIENGRVLGDAYLGEFATKTPAGDIRSYILAIAAEDPELLGLSIVFEPDEFIQRPLSPDAPPDQEAPLPLGRIKDVLAADFVGDPAANRDGLLSRLPPQVLSALPSDLLSKWQDYLKALTSPATSPAAIKPNVSLPEKPIMLNRKLKAHMVAVLGLAAMSTDETARRLFQALGSDGQKAALTAAGITVPEEADSPVSPPTNPVPVVTTLPTETLSFKSAEEQLEEKRVAGLKDLAKLGAMPENWVNLQITAMTSVEDARKEVVAKLTGEMPPVQVSVGEDAGIKNAEEGIKQAIELKMGWSKPTEKTLPLALQLKGRRWLELAKHGLGLAGINLGNKSDNEVARFMLSRAKLMGAAKSIALAHSTADFANLLADTTGRVILRMYNETQASWMAWCNKRTAPNFKTISAVNLSGFGSLTETAEGEGTVYKALSDSAETYYLKKYTSGAALTWEAMINDDLGSFARLPRAAVSKCRSKENDIAYGILTTNGNMSDGSALFVAGHKNLGTTAAITVASVGEARSLLAKQTEPNGGYIDTQLAVLLVPVGKSVVAEQLVGSTVDPSKSNATPNPGFIQRLQVASDPRLDANSATAWYAIGDPATTDTVEIAFLEGEEQPVVTQDDDFDTESRKIRVRHCVAGKAADYRGMVKNAGA